jgi:hypothetical protein
MTPQMHADHLLAVWQQRRVLPPAMRLVDVSDDYEETLDAVRDVMSNSEAAE